MNIFTTIATIVMPMLKKAGVPVGVLVLAARAGADAFLDVIEEKIQVTETQVDDVVIGGVIRVARQLIGIEEEVGSKYEDLG
jgi:hypothetical protein